MKKSYNKVLLFLLLISLLMTINAYANVSYDANFSMTDQSVMVGENVEIILTIESNCEVNAMLLDALDYNENILKFIEFAEYGELITTSALGAEGVDSEKREIALGYTSYVVPKGRICKLVFRAVASGTSEVSMNAFLAKDGSPIKGINVVSPKCNIIVSAKEESVSVTGVSLNKTAATLTEGETLMLTATVAPTNATNKNVTWSSSDTNVATVSNGVVTAKSAGTATITVRTADGSKTALCMITVSGGSKDKVVKCEIGKVSCSAGNTINVPIIITENPGFAAFLWEIEYDHKKLQLIDAKHGENYSQEIFFESDSPNFIEYGYISMTSSSASNYKGTGEVVVLTFYVDDATPDAKYDIKINYFEGVTQNRENVIFDFNEGWVYVSDHVAGDVNGDTFIDTKDAVLLAQYLARWSVSVDMNAADCNADGFVDTKDAVLLAQYLARWDVTLG
ncbi:MAG: Ig-like domain-containing protein [Clostridia bacterium]|nr:Ig-like domain-containing protein [Clostridia bacterium]